MCLLLFGWDCHPRYKLVLAANRDEFLERPTKGATFWSEHPELLAGKDLLQGGTWMGITRNGRWAALTNYRDPLQNKHGAPSRGLLVHDFLTQEMAPEEFLQPLVATAPQYDGYNLLAGTVDSLYYYSNQEKVIRSVPAGIHGLSNSLLDVPWPKVERGVAKFKDYLQEGEIRAEQLFRLMADRQQAPDQQLPQTGVGLEWERVLSSMFIASDDYGTRSTSVLLIDRENRVQFWEKTFNCPRQNDAGTVYYDFCISDVS